MPPNRLKLGMLAAGLATFALLYATQPLLPLLARQFNIGGAQASLAVSLTTGPLAVAIVFAGIVSDRIGRRGLMIGSLLVASLLTCASASIASWPVLLASRFLIGLALAGLPSVAMAYVAEEATGGAIGTVMGLYVAGTTIGGMGGRVTGAIVADHFGWPAALAAIGGAGLASTALFWWAAPPSRGFVSRRHDARSVLGTMARLLGDATMRLLYVEAFLLMGAFVTLYNYAGFHLVRPPYSLSQSATGALFLIYLVGTVTSAWFGRLAGRAGAARIFPVPILLFVAGILLTLIGSLAVFVVGLGMATGGFFGAHSIASSWVSRRAGADRAIAASLYLFFYYMGSSLLGWAGGYAWSAVGWQGIVGYTGLLVLVGLLLAARIGGGAMPGGTAMAAQELGRHVGDRE